MLKKKNTQKGNLSESRSTNTTMVKVIGKIVFSQSSNSMTASLNTSLKMSMDDIKVVVLMKLPPQKIQKPMPLGMNKYCKFHKCQIHNTNKCINLENEINTLIQIRHLQQYKKYTHDDKRQPYEPWNDQKE